MKDIGKQINWFGWILFNIHIPLISSFVIKRRQRKLRKILRGFKRLQSKNLDKNLMPLVKIKDVFEKGILLDAKNHYSPFIFHSALDRAGIITKHFLLKILYSRTAYFPSLFIEILYSIGNDHSKLIYPLPREYRVTLRKYGIEFNDILSDLVWNIYIVIFFLYGFIIGIKNIFLSFAAIFFKKNENDIIEKNDFCYFYNLISDSLPSEDNSEKKPNIISWYINDKKENCPKIIAHNIKERKSINFRNTNIIYKPHIELLYSFKKLIKFIKWFIGATLLCFIDILRGRWWHPLLFFESVQASLIKHQENNMIAKEYMFHNANQIWRPLWTYEVEIKDSKIILWYYSTNYRETNLNSKDFKFSYYYIKEALWPNYYVWDLYDKEFLEKEILIDVNIEIKGVIPFANGKSFNINNNRKNLAIFDVQPFRNLHHLTNFRVHNNYYDPNNVIKFHKDILSIVKSDINVNIKRKRDIGSLAHPRYRTFFNSINNIENIHIIDPVINSSDMIKKSTCVISIPFTSTAHIAHKLNIPSIYYDPTGVIKEDDPILHGIKLINDLNSLKKWLMNNFNN